jgi:hypothetical protein
MQFVTIYMNVHTQRHSDTLIHWSCGQCDKYREIAPTQCGRCDFHFTDHYGQAGKATPTVICQRDCVDWHTRTGTGKQRFCRPVTNKSVG